MKPRRIRAHQEPAGSERTKGPRYGNTGRQGSARDRRRLGHRQGDGGAIITTGSHSGLRMDVYNVDSPAYSASKAGLHALTQIAALEYAGDNIRANAICPGPVVTNLAATRGAIAAAGSPLARSVP